MARLLYDFPADLSFRDAGRQVLLSAFQKMASNIEGTRQGEVEGVHDMRVGSRRLRAGLSVFAKLFPREEFLALEAQVRSITDALAAVRDLDVQLGTLEAIRQGLPENEAYGLERVIARQERRREKEREKLLKALDRLERAKFEKRFLRALDRAMPPPAEGD